MSGRIIITVVLGLLAGGGGAFARKRYKDSKEKRLGILGMQTAGKTRFLSFIRNIEFAEGQTSRKSFESFKYKSSNGKSITIKSGMDIGGGDHYRVDYNKVIDKSDLILYFFDIERYLKNIMDGDNRYYQRSCNSRFEHVFSQTKGNGKSVIIVATHKDKCEFPEDEARIKFDNLIQAKTYKDMLNNIKYVNLTNINEINNLANEIFSSK